MSSCTKPPLDFDSDRCDDIRMLVAHMGIPCHMDGAIMYYLAAVGGALPVIWFGARAWVRAKFGI